LLLIADVLDEAGIRHLLLRSAGVPGLVVDLADRAPALAALAARAADEPLYAKPKGGTAVPVAEYRSSGRGPSSVRVFRPRLKGEL
ncbi:hypothetical protein, partial [Salmonella enterica]|uniref:hypothetical protein n=1 Tax=Salmonella enterica TaxID=28901 RepID=UPI0019D5C0A1